MHQQLCGTFHFNDTPLAPPGTKVIVYKTPDTKQTWLPHSKQGWYIGPSLEHYWCYHVYLMDMWGEQESNTVEVFPDHGDIKFLSLQDLAAYAALDLIAALKNPSPSTTLFIGDK